MVIKPISPIQYSSLKNTTCTASKGGYRLVITADGLPPSKPVESKDNPRETALLVAVIFALGWLFGLWHAAQWR